MLDAFLWLLLLKNQKIKRDKNQFYRLFGGKILLPEIRKSEVRRLSAIRLEQGGIFNDPNELTKELLSNEFRKGDAARPVGEGKYAIVKYHQQAEWRE